MAQKLPWLARRYMLRFSPDDQADPAQKSNEMVEILANGGRKAFNRFQRNNFRHLEIEGVTMRNKTGTR